MYQNLKLRIKANDMLYAIVGQLGDGSYRITPVAEAITHGLMPRPWLEYRPEDVFTVTVDQIESFIAYST